VSFKSTLSTNEAKVYRGIGKQFKGGHVKVNHSRGQYADGIASTDTAESFFSVFKRGMKGTYQQCDEKHLHRYLAEFDFRYNNRIAVRIDDVARTDSAIRGVRGKRLKYQTSH
jgi:hypothetical protein